MLEKKQIVILSNFLYSGLERFYEYHFCKGAAGDRNGGPLKNVQRGDFMKSFVDNSRERWKNNGNSPAQGFAFALSGAIFLKNRAQRAARKRGKDEA